MMSTIADRIRELHEIIPEGVQLVAVSKFHDASQIREAYDAGQRCFGESRVQELLAKIPLLPDDIRWHFIGHLQTNKVRQIVGKVSLVESVDSIRLLSLIDSESRKAGVITNVLMQVHVAQEETKFGFLPEELVTFFKEKKFEELTNTHIAGVMGMASNTDDIERVRGDFQAIADTFRKIKNMYPSDFLRGFEQISMGMSGDWPIAVEEGATMVRIGTAIFGQRNY